MTLSRTGLRPRLGLALIAAVAIPLSVACSDSSSGGGSKAHQNITLLDRLGNPLTVASTEPFSPRLTCGGCHDIDNIANGFHFSQGRTDENGVVQVTDDFFGDGRNYVRSPGMYGKW